MTLAETKCPVKNKKIIVEYLYKKHASSRKKA
jgi:hypothetical protein